MSRYPRSANAAGWRWTQQNFESAGVIYLGNGRLHFPPELARRRAGTVIDLERVRTYRMAGNLFDARARLVFARAARLALT